MHGHFDLKNLNEDTVVDSDTGTSGGINTGIGVVIPVEKILETIDQRELAEIRTKVIKEHRERSAASPDSAKSADRPSSDANPKP
jgi:hypothetical protein